MSRKGLKRRPAREWIRSQLSRRYSTFRPFTLTMFVFGLMVWLYVVAVQFIHPEWLPHAFSHVQFPPFNWRLDEVGMLAFAVAALGFFLWQLEETNSNY